MRAEPEKNHWSGFWYFSVAQAWYSSKAWWQRHNGASPFQRNRKYCAPTSAFFLYDSPLSVHQQFGGNSRRIEFTVCYLSLYCSFQKLNHHFEAVYSTLPILASEFIVFLPIAFSIVAIPPWLLRIPKNHWKVAASTSPNLFQFQISRLQTVIVAGVIRDHIRYYSKQNGRSFSMQKFMLFSIQEAWAEPSLAHSSLAFCS